MGMGWEWDRNELQVESRKALEKFLQTSGDFLPRGRCTPKPQTDLGAQPQTTAVRNVQQCEHTQSTAFCRVQAGLEALPSIVLEAQALGATHTVRREGQRSQPLLGALDIRAKMLLALPRA